MTKTGQIIIESESEFCQHCNDLLEPVYENNGFDAPDPTHMEFIGYKSCPCEER